MGTQEVRQQIEGETEAFDKFCEETDIGALVFITLKKDFVIWPSGPNSFFTTKKLFEDISRGVLLARYRGKGTTQKGDNPRCRYITCRLDGSNFEGKVREPHISSIKVLEEVGKYDFP